MLACSAAISAAHAQGDQDMPNAGFTPKDAAALYNADHEGSHVTSKQMRSFIRRMHESGRSASIGLATPVGSGARYDFTGAEMHALVEAYGRRAITSGAPVQRDVATLRQALADAIAAESADADDDDESDGVA